MELQIIFDRIKSDFCSLTKYKLRGNVLEIITPYSTLNKKFISVFLQYNEGKYIITDGGWVCQNYYESPAYDDSQELVERILNHYQISYKIKTTLDRYNTNYYYKTCTELGEVSSIIFDLSNFLVGVINSSCIQFKDEKEEKERDSFKTNVNNFLKGAFQTNVQFLRPLDDFKSIRFNAIITQSSDIYLITYITGSSSYYFDNDLRRTIVNFEISERSKNKAFIKERLSIINNEASGYDPEKSNSLLSLLNEKTTKEPIKWTEKERLLDLVY